MKHEIPELDKGGLRQFGITTGCIVAVLFGLVLPWLFDLQYPKWPWIVCAVLVIWGLVAPSTLKPVYTGWMWFGLQLSRITTPLVLGIVFFVMFAPVSGIMKLIRRDSMSRSLDSTAKSYRVQSKRRSVESMEKPY